MPQDVSLLLQQYYHSISLVKFDNKKIPIKLVFGGASGTLIGLGMEIKVINN